MENIDNVREAWRTAVDQGSNPDVDSYVERAIKASASLDEAAQHTKMAGFYYFVGRPQQTIEHALKALALDSISKKQTKVALGFIIATLGSKSQDVNNLLENFDNDMTRNALSVGHYISHGYGIKDNADSIGVLRSSSWGDMVTRMPADRKAAIISGYQHPKIQKLMT